MSLIAGRKAYGENFGDNWDLPIISKITQTISWATLTMLLDLATARKLLGPDAVIGVTCSSQEEAFAAVNGGADYLGIGTMYATPT